MIVRLILNVLGLILALIALVWFAIRLSAQPGVIPVEPVLVLAGAALLGALAWLIQSRTAQIPEMYARKRKQAEPLPTTGGGSESPDLPVDLEELSLDMVEMEDPARETITTDLGEPVEAAPEPDETGDDIPQDNGKPQRRRLDRGIPAMEAPRSEAPVPAEMLPDEAAAEDTGEAVSLFEKADEVEMEAEPVAAEDAPVQFSAYYPREVKPEDWQPLMAYILRETAYAEVVADARGQFDAEADIRETRAPARAPVAADALVTAIPRVPGLEFDPPQASTRFRKAWRRFDFEFRAVDAPLDESADGHITFYVEGVIVADVKLSVYVSEQAGQGIEPPLETTAKPYQAVFCSYSHRDMRIVERVEATSRFHFTRFLRDVTTLRSGERWNDRLLDLIEEADIFQLFWSKPAAESQYVRQEWEYALALRRNGAKGRYFIRPVRWEEPMAAPPPPELADLHFELIEELAEV